MSKMGQSFDESLDENKYELYGMVKELMQECEVGYLHEKARKLIAKISCIKPKGVSNGSK